MNILVAWLELSERAGNWHVGDLGEKKGDWFAEKNAEDEDDKFLKAVLGLGANLELSSPASIFLITCSHVPKIATNSTKGSTYDKKIKLENFQPMNKLSNATSTKLQRRGERVHPITNIIMLEGLLSTTFIVLLGRQIQNQTMRKAKAQPSIMTSSELIQQSHRKAYKGRKCKNEVVTTYKQWDIQFN